MEVQRCWNSFFCRLCDEIKFIENVNATGATANNTHQTTACEKMHRFLTSTPRRSCRI